MHVLEDTEKWSQVQKGWSLLLHRISLTDTNWQSGKVGQVLYNVGPLTPTSSLKFQQSVTQLNKSAVH